MMGTLDDSTLPFMWRRCPMTVGLPATSDHHLAHLQKRGAFETSFTKYSLTNTNTAAIKHDLAVILDTYMEL